MGCSAGAVFGALAAGDLSQRITRAAEGTFDQVKTDANSTSEKLASIIEEVRAAADALRHVEPPVAAFDAALPAFERRCRRAEQHRRRIELAAVDRHVARRVARAFLLLVGGVVLLVHHDQAQRWHGRKHRHSGAQHNARRAGVRFMANGTDTGLLARAAAVPGWRGRLKSAAEALLDAMPAPQAQPLVLRWRIERMSALHVCGRPDEALAEGLAAAPEAFLGLLKGKNFGKQLVKLV